MYENVKHVYIEESKYHYNFDNIFIFTSSLQEKNVKPRKCMAEGFKV